MKDNKLKNLASDYVPIPAAWEGAKSMTVMEYINMHMNLPQVVLYSVVKIDTMFVISGETIDDGFETKTTLTDGMDGCYNAETVIVSTGEVLYNTLVGKGDIDYYLKEAVV